MKRFPLELFVKLRSVNYQDKPCELTEDFEYISNAGETIRALKGYRSDFASIPRFFWRIFPPMGRYTYAAIIHDWLCDQQDNDYKHAAGIFLECMEHLDVPKIKRLAMYRAVLWFGPKF